MTTNPTTTTTTTTELLPIGSTFVPAAHGAAYARLTVIGYDDDAYTMRIETHDGRDDDTLRYAPGVVDRYYVVETFGAPVVEQTADIEQTAADVERADIIATIDEWLAVLAVDVLDDLPIDYACNAIRSRRSNIVDNMASWREQLNEHSATDDRLPNYRVAVDNVRGAVEQLAADVIEQRAAIVRRNAATAVVIERGQRDDAADIAAVVRIVGTWIVTVRQGIAPTTVPTGWQIVAYWQHTTAAMAADLANVVRRMRAAVRARGWDDQYDQALANVRFRAVEIRRTTSSAQVSWPDAAGAFHRLAYVSPMTPDAITGATAAAIVAGYDEHVRAIIDDAAAVGAATLAAARRGNWCSDYERTMAQRILPDIEHDAIRDAIYEAADRGDGFETERDYIVSATVQVTLTVHVPVSQTVTATDEDAAADAVGDWSHHIDRYTIAETMGVRAADVDQWNWDFDDYDVTIDEVEEA